MKTQKNTPIYVKELESLNKKINIKHLESLNKNLTKTLTQKGKKKYPLHVWGRQRVASWVGGEGSPARWNVKGRWLGGRRRVVGSVAD